MQRESDLFKGIREGSPVCKQRQDHEMFQELKISPVNTYQVSRNKQSQVCSWEKIGSLFSLTVYNLTLNNFKKPSVCDKLCSSVWHYHATECN